LAKEFAELKPLPGERDERPGRLDYLLRHVQQGTFGGPCWARGIDKSTGVLYRLDGQHSSKLLAALGADLFPKDLLVTVDDWEFDSVDQDAAAVFNLFNHPKSVRSNEDVIGLYRAQSVDLADIPKKLLVHFGNGIFEHQKTVLAPEKGVLLTPRERGLYFVHGKYPFGPFACWAAGFAETKNHDFLARPAIVAEMVSSWKVDPDKATEFWTMVLCENHPEVDHETRTLAETFRQWSMQKKYKTTQYRTKASTAWKHFLREQRQPVLQSV